MKLWNSTVQNRGSLRSMNPKCIVVALILIYLGHYGSAEETAPANSFDLVFVLDIPESITDPDAAKVKDLMKQLTRQLTISPTATRVGIITYRAVAQDTPDGQEVNQNNFDISSFTSFINSDQLEAAIDQLVYHGSYTNTQAGLQAGRTLFLERGRSIVPKSVILISDGPNWSNDPDLARLIEVASHLKIEATITVVGVTNNADMTQLEQIATNKDLAVSFSDSSDLAAMAATILTKINEVLIIPAPDVTPPSTPSASSGATDLVFVVDSSASITATDPDGWTKIKSFIKKFADQFTISQSDTQVGLALFSDDAIAGHDLPGVNPEIPDNIDFAHLTDFSNAVELKEAIDALAFGSSRTNIAAAIRAAREAILIRSNGDREDAPNVVIVLSLGGVAVDQQSELSDEAAKLKEKAMVALVGITNNVDVPELEQIATNENLGVTVPSFSALVGMEASLLTKIKVALLTQ